MLRKIGKRAQTTAEYAILIALVVAAVTAMQIYVKRGMQAKVRDAVDGMSTMGIASTGSSQYEPYYLTSTANTTQDSTANEEVLVGGATDRDSDATTNATRNQTMTAPE